MKRFVLGVLAALSGIGLYKLHKEGKIRIPLLKVKGSVNAVNYEAHSFQIRSDFDHNILMDIAVSPTTKFMWLNGKEGEENTAQFTDMTDGEKVHVAFFKDKKSGRMTADRVVIENA